MTGADGVEGGQPPDQVRARLADNLLLWRRRAGYSQRRLAELAQVSEAQVRAIEDARAIGMLDTSVRLAGALSISLDDLLAGVSWRAGEIEFEVEAGYMADVLEPPTQ